MTEERILVVLDKDGTLTESDSGATFPTAPTDQKLMQGVPEALALLRGDRYSLAIASNQGGCDVFECKASNLQTGMIWHNSPLDRLLRVQWTFDRSDDGETSIYYKHVKNPGYYDSSFVVKKDFKCAVSHKTIESAIEEIKYAADLCGITDAYFCPVMDGSMMWSLRKGIEYGWRSMPVSAMPDYSEDPPNFRKPGPGMLAYHKQLMIRACRTVMIGDRPEDRAAADAAGFVFLDASEWRSGVTVEQAIDRGKVAI